MRFVGDERSGDSGVRNLDFVISIIDFGGWRILLPPAAMCGLSELWRRRRDTFWEGLDF